MFFLKSILCFLDLIDCSVRKSGKNVQQIVIKITPQKRLTVWHDPCINKRERRVQKKKM